MKKVLVSFFAVLMLVAFAGVSFAADAAPAAEPAAKAEPAKKEKAKAATEKMKGTVKSIDAEKGELVVTGKDGADMTFKMKKTQGKGVAAGDEVTVSYTKKGEEMTAKRITKAKAKKEKAEKAAAPAEKK